jgi:hypothetical protein
MGTCDRVEEDIDASMKTPSNHAGQETQKRDLRHRTSAQVLLERRMDMVKTEGMDGGNGG